MGTVSSDKRDLGRPEAVYPASENSKKGGLPKERKEKTFVLVRRDLVRG